MAINREQIKTAFAFITNSKGEILLIQEGFEPSYGKWGLPGGHVDSDEDIKQAVEREVVEETGGLKVKIKELMFTETIPNSKYAGRPEEDHKIVELNVFLASPFSGNIDKNKLTQELDVRWFKVNEIKALPLRWPWLADLL